MSETLVRLPRDLKYIDELLHESVLRVGQAVKNMRELAVSGLPTSTPGNGSPGSGKGGAGRTITVKDDDDDERTVRVPVTSVEAMVLVGESDLAALKLAELVKASSDCAVAAAVVLEAFTGQRPVTPPVDASPIQLVAYSSGCAVVLVHLGVPERWHPERGWLAWSDVVRSVWNLTQAWGWEPAEPDSTGGREVLAADLTGKLCRSCLRVGERKDRHRHYEFCSWCQNFTAVEGFTPPFKLVQDHHCDVRITEAMIIPYRQAHRAKLKRLARK